MSDVDRSPQISTEPEELRRSTRDPDALRERLRQWFESRLPGGAAPQISRIGSPSSTGMSSETLLFDASWREEGRQVQGAFVARVEPDVDDCPVFPVYDLVTQFEIMRLVGMRSRVPVPRVRFLERDPGWLGAPFFVMDRVEGRVPPDVMPYTFASWLLEAKPEEQRRLQDASVGVLADLHGIDANTPDLAFLDLDLPGSTPLRRHFESQRRYYDWARESRRHPVLEAAFAWLEDNWPESDGRVDAERVISWGDARIGNIVYRGFEPAAVLDWEMATLGPRELDLGWMIFLHCFFHEIAVGAGLPGMPDFMRSESVGETYRSLTGHAPRALPFFEVYAALRHGIVMTRVHARRVRFGEAVWDEDVDSVIYHRPTLERMLDGSWWS